MSQVYSTPAILLRQIELVGGDRLGVFFTQQFGKRTILLQGVKKHTAKLQYRLQEGTLREIEFIQGKSLPRLTGIYQSTSEKPFPSSYHLHLRYWIGQFLDSMIADEAREPEVFEALAPVIESNWYDSSPEIYHTQQFIVLRSMALLGYELNCTECVVSGTTKNSQFFLSVAAGGLLVPQALTQHPEGIPVSKQDIVAIKQSQRGILSTHTLPREVFQQYHDWYGIPPMIDVSTP